MRRAPSVEHALRNVVFVAPFPLETTLLFCRAAAALADVRLIGVFQEAPPPGLFADVVTVADAMDPRQLVDAGRLIEKRHGSIHRLLGVLEDAQGALATARRVLGVPGLDEQTVRRFRDKAHMKDCLRAAGLPCARHRRLHGASDAWAFADEVGYPMVLKPPAGAGSRATYRVDNPDDLARVLAEIQPSPQREMLAEEFLSGREFSFETLTLRGKPLFHSIGRYLPGPLEVMRTEWIQWVVHLPRDISTYEFDDARQLGFRALDALGLGTAMTHMEWFRRGDGSLAIGEIAARPPGAQIVRLMSYAHDTDMYRAWARLMIDEAFDGPYTRKYSVGVAFLRGAGRGKITAVEGIEEAQRKMGALVVEARLPQIGAPRASGYEGEGWVIVRHPDDEVVKRALHDLITTVKICYAS